MLSKHEPTYHVTSELLIMFVCLFVFLELQPNMVVFSQPRSGF
jgi:hypothetical protein